VNVSPRTSVIVLNYNGAPWLRRCLTALRAEEGQFEILVVDNASADGSADTAEGFDGVRLLRLERNRGFAGGNNAAAREAAGTEYLVFLNNDTEVQPGFVSAFERALDRHPDAGLATAHIVSLGDPAVVDSAGDGYLRAGGAFKRWHGERRPPGAAPEEVFGACGAAFAIRKSLFERLDGFDEDFFMVYEDVDLSYRARLAGWRCLYVPAAVVLHAGSGTLGRESAPAVYYGQRNLEWVWIKNTPGPLLWRSLLAHVAYSLAGAAFYARRGHAGAVVRAKAAALAALPSVVRARQAASGGRRVECKALWSLMTPRWWSVKWQEKAGRGGGA
jgi:GT2 family glycosyltransferase